MRQDNPLPDGIADTLRKIPKADLHVHLEGSVTPKTLKQLARKNKVSLSRPLKFSGGREIPPPLLEHVEHGFGTGDFWDFIRLYVKISECIQDPGDLVTIALAYALQAAGDGVVAAEMYVTPTTLLSLNLSQAELFQGLKEAEQSVKREAGVELRWIFDIVRNSAVPGDATLEHALAARKAGISVSAIGVAGLEAGYPAAPFAPVLKRARDAGFSILIHAGETAPSASIWDAIRSGPPERIGHGVTADDDPSLLAELKKRAITLEICPASNLALGVLTPGSTALTTITESGVPFVIGSDDPGIFGRGVLENYLLAAVLGVSPKLLHDAARRSLQLFENPGAPS